MTIEVTTNFVSDRLIYVNMTRETAKGNKDTYNAFNAANTDGDDKISEKEYATYLKKSCSIDVKTMDVVCTKAAAPTQYRKDLLENTQVDFYPDLELGNIPVGAKNVYKLIDLDKNNKLSKEEITAFNKARNLFEQTKNVIMKKCDKHGIKFGSVGLAGMAATLGSSYCALDGIAILGSTGPVGWGIAAVAALGTAGYLLYESHSYEKECRAIEQKLLEQTNNHPYVLEHLKEISLYYD